MSFSLFTKFRIIELKETGVTLLMVTKGFGIVVTDGFRVLVTFYLKYTLELW